MHRVAMVTCNRQRVIGSLYKGACVEWLEELYMRESTEGES